VTVTGETVLGPQSPFAKLRITVNQTRGLSNQAISVTWSGATPTDTDQPVGDLRFDDNYLQIFQCWGPDDHSNPLDPGPAPVGCEFGANELNPSWQGLSTGGPGPISRRLLPSDTSPQAYRDPTGGTFMPFRPSDGSPPINVPILPSSNPAYPGGIWQNPYFDFTTTNEVDYSKTYPSGTGSELFTVDTGLEAPGLGCGEHVTQPNGSAIAPQCWLVIVPRGAPATENPVGDLARVVDTSGLSSNAWSHRIALPLSFNPVGSSCRLGSNERRIIGGELAESAIVNWEPSLCKSAASPPYQYSPESEDQARQELLSGASGGPGMAVVTRPISPSLVLPTNPVTYAPTTLSAVVIGFNVDRILNVNADDPAERALDGQRVAHLYLTPRLIAKLLTESYLGQFRGFNPAQPATVTGHGWLSNNPSVITSDPDFLRFNSEFSLLDCRGLFECGGLVVEQPTSDAAWLLWQWVLADPEARAWLDGVPDQWGMRVNPLYSPNAKINPSGIPFGNPAPESFPKSDPYTYQDTTQLPAASNQLPRPIGMQDFLPYAASVQSAAAETRQANDGNKLVLNTSALSPDTAWTATGPQVLEGQFMLSITDSADAAEYGLQTASLSRAGDDRPNRTFVAPDMAGIEAGQQAMTPSAVPGVQQTNVSTTRPGAYPLPTLTYAAVAPASLSKSACTDYAALISYAAGTGQTSGTDPGDLPPGYAPLAPGLRSEATNAAKTIVANCGKQSGASAHGGSSSPPPLAGSSNASPTGPGTATGSGSSSTAAASTVARSSGNTKPANGGTSTPYQITSRNAASSGSPGRTLGSPLGLIGLILPILLIVGLIAALAARWVDVWNRRIRRPRGAR
jgi:hypothetical protein